MRNVPVSEAKAQLTELVRLAEAGEEVTLTRHGVPAVRLTPVRRVPDADAKLALIKTIQRSARGNRTPGPSAARSQDFLYDDAGLPE